MKVYLKTKIRFGLSFLFVLMLIVGGLGGFYIKRLAIESSGIMKDNYKSIVSSKLLMQALDSIEQFQREILFNKEKDEIKIIETKYQEILDEFDVYLIEIETNITEKGEKQIVIDLRSSYDQYKDDFINAILSNDLSYDYYYNVIVPSYKKVKATIYQISDINMKAIFQKTSVTQNMAGHVFIYMIIILGLCILITMFVIVKFPRYIANPIRKLIQSIQQISNKNYQERLYFESNDEFYQLAEAFNSMAQKLDEYEHSNLANILYEKKRIESIINNIHDAIIGLNENKIVLFANKSCSELLQVDISEIQGKLVTEVAANNKLLFELIEDLYLGSEPIKQSDKQIQIIRNGKEVYYSKEIIEVTSSKTADNKQFVIGYVIILKNVTKFHELDEAKTNFIATISHELKTPISSIRMSSRLLEDLRIGQLNEEQKQLISNIKDDTERILKITDELIDISQIETGHIKLKFQPVSPSQIIDYAYDTLKIQAENKNVKIDIKVDNYLPMIHADIEKTTWVLVNLISNAIRYSENNSTITIRAERSRKKVTFSVSDTGKGIPEQYKEKIFQKFFIVPDNQPHGSGLGLAICKEFINEQHGEIWFVSESQKGSTFYFSLPVSKNDIINE